MTRYSFKNVFLLFPFLLLGCGSSGKFVNHWQNTPIVADGKATDWGEGLAYSGDTKFWYKVSNDENNLYVVVKITDETLQRKVITCGFTLWVDTTNGRKQSLGIYFPVQNEKAVALGAKKQKDAGGFTTDKLKELTKGFDKLALLGFNHRDTTFQATSESTVKTALNFDESKALLYECIIPLMQIYAVRSGAHPISIGLVTGFMRNNTGFGSGGPGGPPDGGMGGPDMMGEGGGAPPDGMQSDMEQFSAPTKYWIRNYVLTPASPSK